MRGQRLRDLCGAPHGSARGCAAGAESRGRLCRDSSQPVGVLPAEALPMSSIGVQAAFVVTATQILDERMTSANHSGRTERLTHTSV